MKSVNFNEHIKKRKDFKRIEELKSLIGNYDSFNLDLEDLERMRNER